MPLAPWLRALDAVGTVAEAARLFRGSRAGSDAPVAPDASDLERGLANVVVAALKEAFDRDRARFELDREEREVVRARAEQVLRDERVRQAGIQAIGQVRLLAVITVTLWVASVAAAGFLAPVPVSAKWLLGSGWTALGAALAAAFRTHQHLASWVVREADTAASPRQVPNTTAQTALPWLVLAGFVLIAASVLAGV